MCHSGVGLIPTIDGIEHHFSAGGLYNGVVLLIDDETGTYWDHITGQAVYGPLAGTVLDSFALEHMTVTEGLRRHPDLQVSISRPGLAGQVFGWLNRRVLFSKGWFPPMFRGTLGPPDERLDEYEHGLGVVVGSIRRFYPMAAVPCDDPLDGQVLQVRLSADGVPEASFVDGSRPMQLFTRWYGFSYAYPGCEIYEE